MECGRVAPGTPDCSKSSKLCCFTPTHLLSMLILELGMGSLGPCLSCTGVTPALVLCAGLSDILTRLHVLAMNLSHHLAIVCSHWAADRSIYPAGRSQSLHVLWLTELPACPLSWCTCALAALCQAEWNTWCWYSRCASGDLIQAPTSKLTS